MTHLEELIPRDLKEGSVVRCYRYLGSHWLDSLERMELKTADVDDFNDIFDGRGAVTGLLSAETVKRYTDKEIAPNIPGLSKDQVSYQLNRLGARGLIRLYSDCIKNAIANRVQMHESRILCFSCPENIGADRLMWSHYANHWKGVRLGFDLLYDLHREIDFKLMTTPFVIDRVRYDDKRPIMDLSKLENIVGDAYFTFFFRNFLLTKGKEWEYEHEWRMLVLKDEAERRYVDNRLMYFWKFHPHLLRRIDIGPLVNGGETREIVALVQKIYPHAEVNRVRLHEDDYGFDYVPVKR